MSTKHDQHESEPDRGTQPAALGAADSADAVAARHAIADDLHALALVISAALSVPLASEWHAL